jgi:hypothetical protein
MSYWLDGLNLDAPFISMQEKCMYFLDSRDQNMCSTDEPVTSLKECLTSLRFLRPEFSEGIKTRFCTQNTTFSHVQIRDM